MTENTSPDGKFRIWIVVGSNSSIKDMKEDAIQEHTYDTEAELKAFKEGLDAADGWLEVSYYETPEEAKEHVTNALG
jgi:hypothetical protein